MWAKISLACYAKANQFILKPIPRNFTRDVSGLWIEVSLFDNTEGQKSFEILYIHPVFLVLKGTIVPPYLPVSHVRRQKSVWSRYLEE